MYKVPITIKSNMTSDGDYETTIWVKGKEVGSFEGKAASLKDLRSS